MHDLIPITELPTGVLTTAEIEAAMGYADAEKAPATRAAYESDWRDFTAWCAARDACPLPAHQGIVAAYLSHLADQGRRASTIGRRCASIAWHHKQAGIEHPPTAAPGVRAVLKGIRRTIGAASAPKAPEMTAHEVMAALEWHDHEAARLQHESDGSEARIMAAPGSATPAELEALANAHGNAIVALEQSNRLTRAVLAQCPPRYRDVPLKEGLPRWWGA